MELIEKTREGSYTIGISHWELLMLEDMVNTYMNETAIASAPEEHKLQADLTQIIDRNQREGE